jgi:MFS transporter, ACS family, hexuronate transporter
MMSRPRHYEFTLISLLVLLWGSVGLNRVGIGAIFPEIVPAFHMKYWQTSLLISGTSVTWAISSWAGGWLSDRYGRRWVLLPAALWICVSTAAMGAAWGFFSMFIIRDLLGIGDGIGWSVGESVISEESTPQRRGFNQALFTAGYTLIGAGLGYIIITRLSAALGWRWVFPIIGAATLLVVIGLALVMREPRERAAHRAGDWHAGFRALRRPSLVYITVMGCAILTWLQVTIGFDPLFLTNVRGFSKVDAGSIAAVWGIAGTAGQVIVPLASDFWGRRPVTLVSALACAASLFGYIAGGFDMLGMQVLLGISGFFGFGVLPVVLATCVSEAAPEEIRGSALGVTNFFGVIIGTTLMPFVAGLVADHMGLAAAMWIPVAAQIVVAVFIMAITETAPRVVARRAALRSPA